ncbi:MAG: PQQ-binding-like beta-propeller repeat protein [Planctomycetia bacterium]|nr:PQQ-binding-like beta-propeller repeat protein [Planctomycetia bacterium]
MSLLRRSVVLLPLVLLGHGLAPSAEVTPQWVWELPARRSAWETTPRMPLDGVYTPVVQGKLVLVGCEHNGVLLALDLETGAERWRFYTEGPVRAAPRADAERIYLASDDGHLYCLDHAGKLQWKFRGGPSARKVLGHERLISAWPAGVRPVLADGTIYYVAGYWPLDGVFVHALDARTGAVRWTNGTAQYRPTGAPRVLDGKLFVDGHGGSGAYDIRTGAAVADKAPPAEKAAPPELPGGRQLTTTPDGKIQCVADKGGPLKQYGKPTDSAKVDTKAAEAVLVAAQVTEGYCLVAGLNDGALVEGLLRQSKLHVIAADADTARVEQIRRRLDARGLFDDHRLSVLAGDPAKCGLPPYFASLIVSEREGPVAEAVRAALRPHGGTLVERGDGKLTVSRRDGPLAGAGTWTHEFGDPANTLTSRDTLVKAPLGLLWYGGPAAAGKYYFDGNVDHQSGDGINPQPAGAEVIDGRMILQGPGLLAAFDIYTGRRFWEAPLPKMFTFGGAGGGLGIHSKKYPQPWKAPEALQAEVPPTQHCRASGFDFVSVADGIYVAAGPTLIRFHPADGKRLAEWKVPLDEKDLCWGNVRVTGKLLVATAFRPQDLADAQAGHDGQGGEWAGDRMPMAYLLAVDRETGKLVWSRKAAWGFLNRGGVAIGGDKAYCVDLLLETAYAKLKEAGRKFPDTPPTLYALDLQSGQPVWSRPLDVLVKNIVYSEKRDLLVVPCRNLVEWKDGAWASAKGAKSFRATTGKMRGLQGADGKVVWEVAEAPYFDPHVLLDDLLIDRDGVTYDLKTGKRAERTSPLTGEPETWSFKKAGCNHLIACDSMVTWRCAFYDLAGGSGTMPLKGMDAGCTPTLLPAGGVLNIPNFGTHHKRNRMTALALVHVADNPLWATATAASPGPAVAPAPLRRAGFNFGAPGDRKADDGTFWLAVGAKTPGVIVKGPTVDWFELHPSQTGHWVGAGGVLGATDITVPTTLAAGKNAPTAAAKRRYDVRLYFVEPQSLKPGARVFSVSLEGKPVLNDLDVLKEAGGPFKPAMREFKDVEVEGPLDIRLAPTAGATLLSGVEIIAR